MELIVKDVVDVTLEGPLDKVIHGNRLKIIRRMPSEIVDVVFFGLTHFLSLLDKERLIRWEVKVQKIKREKICDCSIGIEVNKR